MSFSLRGIIGTFIVIILFVCAEIVAQTYTPEIQSILHTLGVGGQIFFVLMAMLAVIVPVWSNMFLLPFGVMMWGPLETALLCIVGWWIGSLTSFYIGRMYQEWLLRKYPSLTRYRIVDSYIPHKHTLVSLVFLRMTMPVDVLSYALGLFSARISWKQNAITTLIGITPFAFVFSYIGELPLFVQVSIFVVTTGFFVLYFVLQKKKTIS